MTTPNHPTDFLDLDRRDSDGNPFPAAQYDRNMEVIDTNAKTQNDALANKLETAGGDLAGLLRMLFDGQWIEFGTNSDKFTVLRVGGDVNFCYNAHVTDQGWELYDGTFPAFRMVFTNDGTLEFYTTPFNQAVSWTKRTTIDANNLTAISPFLALTTAQFNGDVTFNSAATFKNFSLIAEKVISAQAGMTMRNTLTELFEGIWSMFGSASDKFVVQRTMDSVYLTYNMHNNGTNWIIGNSNFPSMAIQYTQTGEINFQYAAPGSLNWTTIASIKGNEFDLNKPMYVNSGNAMMVLGNSQDKLSINRTDQGSYNIGYNCYWNNTSWAIYTAAYPATRLEMQRDGSFRVLTYAVGASQWSEALNVTASAINILRALTIGAAVNLTEVLTTSKQIQSTLPTGQAPLQVASTTKVNNLNAALLDGHTAEEFMPEADTWDYVSNWQAIGSTTTFTHNLGAYPTQVILHFSTASSGNPMSIVYPTIDDQSGTAYAPTAYFPNNDSIVIKRPTSVGYKVGTNTSGVNQSAGYYKVYLKL